MDVSVSKALQINEAKIFSLLAYFHRNVSIFMKGEKFSRRTSDAFW